MILSDSPLKTAHLAPEPMLLCTYCYWGTPEGSMEVCQPCQGCLCLQGQTAA